MIFKEKSLNLFDDVFIKPIWVFFEVLYVHDSKQPILMLPSKCAGVGEAKNSQNSYMRCGRVRDEKLLCA